MNDVKILSSGSQIGSTCAKSFGYRFYLAFILLAMASILVSPPYLIFILFI